MKKFLKLTMVLVLVFFSGVNVSAKSGDEAYSYVKVIDEKYQKRIAGSSMEKDMAKYISDELVSFGYSTKKEDFSFTRGGKQVDSQNIVAIKKGKSTKQIIVGAHYDSVGTNGVDDNGSGVSLTLESAKKLANTNMDYTIVFVFFGSEEVGLQGSKAYVNAMSQNEIDNTILMVNIDSVLSGTYPYIYGGEFKDNKIVDKWGVEQGMELSKELGLDLRTNDTKLNYHYPTPTTGNWSDHASFKKVGIPHIYLEASNWEVLDDVNNPGEGSSGASESEIGAIMHVPSRDNLSFINQEFPGRAQSNLSTYSSFLINYLQRVSPSGLKKVNKPIYKKVVNGNTSTYYKLVNDKYMVYKKEVKSNNKKVVYDYSLVNRSVLNTKTNYFFKTNKVNKKEVFKYNKKGKVYNYCTFKINKKNKFVNVYQSKKSYNKNNSVKEYSIVKKDINNKKVFASLSKYKNNKKYKYVKYEYKKGVFNKRFEYIFNNKYQLRENKNSKAIRYTTYYKKNKAYKTYKNYYNKKGKLIIKNYYAKLRVGLK